MSSLVLIGLDRRLCTGRYEPAFLSVRWYLRETPASDI
jgi:hypothetical protein